MPFANSVIFNVVCILSFHGQNVNAFAQLNVCPPPFSEMILEMHWALSTWHMQKQQPALFETAYIFVRKTLVYLCFMLEIFVVHERDMQHHFWKWADAWINFFFRTVTAKSKSSLTPSGKKQTQPGTNTNPSWKEGHFWWIISWGKMNWTKRIASRWCGGSQSVLSVLISSLYLCSGGVRRGIADWSAEHK